MTVVFAQIREDAAVERAHFRDARHILTVASGGCMAFSLLTDDVATVHAVDANPAQIALVALKAQLIDALDLADFLVVAGEADGPRAELLARHAPAAPSQVVAHGLLHAGINEAFYRFLGANLRRAVLSPEIWQELLTAPDLETQRAWLERYTWTPSWGAALGVLLSRATHEHFFGPEIFAHVGEHHFSEFFVERFATEVSRRPAADNPFLHQVLFGRYAPHARPHYLTEPGYAEVKRNLHKLRLTSSAVEALPVPRARYDALTLSNLFDWAAAPTARAVCERLRELAEPGARVVVRQMLDDRHLPLSLRAADTALDAANTDRSMLYRRIACGVLCEQAGRA